MKFRAMFWTFALVLIAASFGKIFFPIFTYFTFLVVRLAEEKLLSDYSVIVVLAFSYKLCTS